jgi:hypothetical protein
LYTGKQPPGCWVRVPFQMPFSSCEYEELPEIRRVKIMRDRRFTDGK